MRSVRARCRSDGVLFSLRLFHKTRMCSPKVAKAASGDTSRSSSCHSRSRSRVIRMCGSCVGSVLADVEATGGS